jgi:hypothetical protein
MDLAIHAAIGAQRQDGRRGFETPQALVLFEQVGDAPLRRGEFGLEVVVGLAQVRVLALERLEARLELLDVLLLAIAKGPL